MNAIPARNLRVLGAGLALLVVLATAIGIASRGHSPSTDAGIATTADAVALGILDQPVVDAVRAGGTDAFVNLNVDPLIAEAYRRFPTAGDQGQLVDELDRLLGGLKDRLATAPGGAAIVDRLEGLARVKVHFTSEGDLLRLLRQPFVASIRANKIVELTLKESTVLVHQPEVKAQGYDGNGTYVAVVDVHNRAAEFPDYFPAGSVAMTYQAKGTDGSSVAEVHGTHVASTVLAIAPATRIVAADVFSLDKATGRVGASSESIADGVRWVIDLKKAWIRDHTQCCDVVAMNLSLGDPKSFRYIPCDDDYSFELAYAVGIIPVVAAGNDAHPNDQDPFASPDEYDYGLSEPSCGRHALSVGSSTDGAFAAHDNCRESVGADNVSVYSQSAATLSLLAPGQCITAAGGSLNGTSMAAPHVAGAVAVLVSAKRDATPAEIWNALVSSGPTISDARFDPPVTKHRLDLEAAVQTLLSGTPPQAAPAPPEGSTEDLQLAQTNLDLAEPLYGGEQRSLGLLHLRNAGSGDATYTFSAVTANGSTTRAAPSAWFDFAPRAVTLGPGEAATAEVRVTVPLGADAGTYTALVLPANAQPGTTAVLSGLRTTFVVREGNLAGGIGALAARAAGTAWPWLGLAAIIVLGVAWRRRRERA